MFTGSPDGPRTGTGLDEHVAGAEDRSLVAAAFRALPERRQTVLWHAVVEEEPRAQVAAALGTTQSHVNVLVFRARESLREAYLALHASTVCAGYAAALARAVRRRGASRGLRAHLSGCPRCADAYAELTDLDRCLRAALLPVALLPAVLGETGAPVGAGAAAKAGALHKLASLPAVGAVTGVALVAVPVVVVLNRPEDAPRGPSTAVSARPATAGTQRSRAASPAPGATAAVVAEPVHRRTAAPSAAPSGPPVRTASPPVPRPGVTARQRAIRDGAPMIAAANGGRTANGVPRLRTDDRLNRAAGDQAPRGGAGRSPATRAIGAACVRAQQGTTWCSLILGEN